MFNPSTQDKQDLLRAVMVIIIFMVVAFLVYSGKLDSTVLVGFISGIGGYYFKTVELKSTNGNSQG
jgi:hypothetical protein